MTDRQVEPPKWQPRFLPATLRIDPFARKSLPYRSSSLSLFILSFLLAFIRHRHRHALDAFCRPIGMICLRVYVCLTINILHLEEPRQESSLRAPWAPWAPWRGRERSFLVGCLSLMSGRSDGSREMMHNEKHARRE